MRTKLEIASAFGNREELAEAKSFFLVGIGGAGMAGVARLLKGRGFRVRGTDLTASAVTEELGKAGIQVWIGHTGEPIEPGDAVILSDAIPLELSPEVARARELELPIYRRSQALGWLLQEKKTIAVTGSHGKTTTTGMISAGLRAAGMDPTIVVGAEIPELGTSVVDGIGEFAVVEACEAYDSLHDFDPEIVVLLNLELDHVDFHVNWENLRDSMTRFVNRAKVLVYNLNDSGASEIAERVGIRKVGFDPSLVVTNGEMRQKGAHNVANAAAAWAAVQEVGGSVAALEGIRDFGGAERRQQVYLDRDVAGFGRLVVLDDYAHHPTEVRASLGAIRKGWIEQGKGERLVVVFQPHLYSRTAPLIQEFAEALDEADLVVMTDIYPAREDPIPGVSSWRVLEKVTRPGLYIPARQELPMKVAEIVQPGDVVVGMGAGNIQDFAGKFVEEMGRFSRERKRVWVAYGGVSAEREVSLHSGRAVYKAVQELGYETRLVDLHAQALGKGDLSDLVGPDRPDLVFLALHGEGAEDGVIQGLLETFGVRYTGCGIQACAVAMDKEATKRVLRDAGVPVPAGVLLRKGDDIPEIELPVVVKPNAQGSTVGLSFVHDLIDLNKAIERAFAHSEEVLIEELVVGVEISVPVMGDRALPPVEIVPLYEGGYDFANKYTPGYSDEICPARLTDDQLDLAMRQAVMAHKALGCAGLTRTDMIVTDDKIVALELNNLPGMTATSLVRKSAETAGITFNELVDWIIQDGLKKPL
jgi:D-alanine--D-alanine ligase